MTDLAPAFQLLADGLKNAAETFARAFNLPAPVTSPSPRFVKFDYDGRSILAEIDGRSVRFWTHDWIEEKE